MRGIQGGSLYTIYSETSNDAWYETMMEYLRAIPMWWPLLGAFYMFYQLYKKF